MFDFKVKRYIPMSLGYDGYDINLRYNYCLYQSIDGL